MERKRSHLEVLFPKVRAEILRTAFFDAVEETILS